MQYPEMLFIFVEYLFYFSKIFYEYKWIKI